MPAALLLAHHPDGVADARMDRFERVNAAMPELVRLMDRHDHVAPRTRIRTWSHPRSLQGGCAEGAPGGWLTAVGNPTRAGLAGLPGDAVLAHLLADFTADPEGALASLSPPFALAWSNRAGGPVNVAVDRCGLQHLYLREEDDGTVWIASSSLALAAALGATFDEDAAAEWLAAGHFVSQRTFAREVRKLAPGEWIELDERGCTVRSVWTPPADPAPAVDDDYRRAFLGALADSDEGDGTAAELTGGLDSRLVLSGRLEGELSTLSWTLGQPGCSELRVVDRLRSERPFDHVAVPLNGSLAGALPELTAAMHEQADGEVNALEYAPLLVAFAELEDRRSVSVSGSGGEIARGYYYAAAGRSREVGSAVDVGALVHKLTGATGAARASMRRDVFPDPLEPLRRAVERAAGTILGASAETVLDDFYIRARMQRFGGRNITTTGLHCRQALPFFDNRVVDVSLGLDAARKRQGRVVRDAVARWTPELARVPLDSGMAVAAPSWRTPASGARWAGAMGRKAAARYGGRAGRLAASRAPDVVPWASARTEPAFRDFVRDLLPATGARVHRLLDPAATSKLVEDALTRGPLYPLGLVLTLELTLRRLEAAPPTS
jgi:asparagine synthase (glutamine-hydrolysing)